MSSSKSRWFATLSVVALATYLTFVLVAGLTIGPLEIRTRHALLLLVAVSLGVFWLSRRLAGSDRRTTLLNMGAASTSVLLALLAADFMFSFWQTRNAPDAVAQDVAYQRASDPVIWHGELYPRTFHPTDRSFLLYKPAVSLHGLTYGEYYEHRLLRSQLLRDSVLEYRQVRYDINRHGLREEAAFSEARIFALGDSYVFGYATDEGAIWPDVLEQSIGEDIYNLGVSATGPKQQVQLLEYLLAAHADSMRIRHLLWMIYEGNDLENSYAELRQPPEVAGEAREPGLLTALGGLPRALREGSVLHAVVSGGVRLRPRALGGTTEIDGVQLRNPLYHSARWGYRLFNPADIRSATRGEAYVRGHPNAAALQATLRRVRELSRSHGFRVTVLLAPSDVRLYGASFEGMPALADRSTFLEHVGRLSGELGFQVVDLATLMKPHAARELLYYRDDHHWNVRGNAVAAELIAGAVDFSAAAGRTMTSLNR